MPDRVAPELTVRLRLQADSDPRLTLRQLWHGPGDPTMLFGGDTVVRASLTAAGPATVRLELRRAHLVAQAWGPGRDHAIAALPALLGQHDEPGRLVARHPLVAQLMRRFTGLRMTRTERLFEALVPAIVGQKVTDHEARRSYRLLVRRFGRPAPGPFGLTLPPEPVLLAAMPYHRLHRSGIERRRAETISGAARRADGLEQLTRLDPSLARQRLTTLPGIGRWTAAETVRLALGDPDALSVGDYNLPHIISWALAGEPRGDDERMLELLEPYRGQRARVALLLTLTGVGPPRRGPRRPARQIAGI